MRPYIVASTQLGLLLAGLLLGWLACGPAKDPVVPDGPRSGQEGVDAGQTSEMDEPLVATTVTPADHDIEVPPAP